MESDLITGDIQLAKVPPEDALDAEFDQHNVDVEEILARTQRSFSTRPRRQVQLYEAPEFVKRLNAFEEVAAGDTVVFQCQWRAFPKPTIKWYKDDEEITEDPRYDTGTEEEGSGIIKLIVTNAQKADEGAYKCKAENSEGVASTTGYLSVSGGTANEDKTLAAKQKKERKEKKQQQKQQQQQQQQQTQGQGEADDTDSSEDASLRKVQSDSKVSYPPHLRTIVEQQSLEEREAESLRNQPPSPIQEFIEKMQTGRGRGATWPYAVLGYTYQDEDAQSNSSDTSVESQIDFDFTANCADDDDDDDVFDTSESDECQRDKAPIVNAAVVNSISKGDPSKSPLQEQKPLVNSSIRPMVCQVPQITVSKTQPTAAQRYKGSSPKRKSTEFGVPKPKYPPLDLSRAFDLLDTPWIIFLPITSSMAFVASATQMNPFFVVLIMTIVSLVAFHVLCEKEENSST